MAAVLATLLASADVNALSWLQFTEPDYLPMNRQGMYNQFQLINRLYEYRSSTLTTKKDKRMKYSTGDQNKHSAAFYCGLLCCAWSAYVQGAQNINIGAIHQVPPTMIGANTVTRKHLPHHEPWYDPETMASLLKIDMSLLRYPGGARGQEFNWTLGLQREFEAQVERRQYLPEHTKVATDAIDGKTVWMLNVIDEPLQDIIQALKVARYKGAEIKYIELGNEGRLFFERWATGREYGIEMNTWATRLKAEFPDSLFSIPLTLEPNKDPRSRKSQWNTLADSAMTDYDAYTLHFYVKSKLKEGYDYDTIVASEQQAQWDNFTTNASSIAKFVGRSQDRWIDRMSHENLWLPENKPVWFTEFGMTERPYILIGTWADGLANFVFYHLLISQDNTRLVTEHQYIELYHGSTESFSNINIDVGQNLTTVEGDLTAEGHVMKALTAVARDKEIVAKIDFPQANIITPGGGVDPYSSLIGLQFSDRVNSNVIMANISDQAQTIETSVLGAQGAKVTVINADNFYTFVRNAADVTYSTSPMAETLELPAYSIVIITDIQKTLDPNDGSIKYTPKFTDTRIAEGASASLLHSFDLARHASDQNSNETLSFSLTGVNPDWVSINADGELEFNATNVAIGSVHEVYIRVEDSTGLTDYATLDVEVLDGLEDTDGDTVVNNDEFVLGTHALDQDTDNDGFDDAVDAYPLNPARGVNSVEFQYDGFDSDWGNWFDGGIHVLLPINPSPFF